MRGRGKPPRRRPGPERAVRERPERRCDVATVLGHSVLRSEDPALLTGRARFMADVGVSGALHAVFVRSHLAHGVVRAVHTEAAATSPGTHSVWTADSLDLPDQRAFTGEADLARPF